MRPTLAPRDSDTLSGIDGVMYSRIAAAPAEMPAAVAEPARSQWDRYTLTDGIETQRPSAAGAD